MSGPSDIVRPDLEDAVFALGDGDVEAFDALDEAIAAFQREHNPVVRGFGDAARHLPIAAFRVARVATFPEGREEAVFRSSGTGESGRAVHAVRRLALYERSVALGFAGAFGEGPWTVIGYVPAYATDSSLVHMVRYLAARSGGAVFADDAGRLVRLAESAVTGGRTPVVIGAAFGLVDLAESGRCRLPDGSFIVETGGMKTHRRSIGREALHEGLSVGLGVGRDRIGSEYGMCELSSQAWAVPGARFRTPPWMRVDIVDPERPDRVLADGERGLVAVTDLANLYTASRILTEDAGRRRGDTFEVLGRATGAELRGCNLLLEDVS